MGEDAAHFDVQQQSTGKWVFFTVELAVVLGIMYVVSFLPHCKVVVTVLDKQPLLSGGLAHSPVSVTRM